MPLIPDTAVFREEPRRPPAGNLPSWGNRARFGSRTGQLLILSKGAVAIMVGALPEKPGRSKSVPPEGSHPTPEI